LLAANIVAGVPIKRGGFSILVGPAPAAEPTPQVPVNTALPAISPSVAYEGTVLTASAGTWTNTPTGYAYQWYRDAAPISGATSAQYTLPAGSGGAEMRCDVTASNAAGPGTTASSPARDVF